MKDSISERQLYENTTGIASDDMYRMSGSFIAMAAKTEMPTCAHRLLHVIAHGTCQTLPEWSEYTPQPSVGFALRSKLLRSRQGLERENGNRSLTRGLAVIGGFGWFDWIGYKHGREWLDWRWNDDVLAMLLHGERYGLFDASGLPTLRRPVDFQVYNQVSLCRRMWRPRFRLCLEEMGAWFGKKDVGWTGISTRFQEALQRSCSVYGVSAVVVLSCEGGRRGIDTVDVRVLRPGCGWSRKDLARLSTYARKCVLIDAERTTSCSPSALSDLLSQTDLAPIRSHATGLK